jgi:hypothetical protein
MREIPRRSGLPPKWNFLGRAPAWMFPRHDSHSHNLVSERIDAFTGYLSGG